MRILVAEDDAPMAQFLHHGLCQENFSVQVAADGTEAQRLACEMPFDLLLLDLNLPGSSGYEVLRTVRVSKPNLPVLIVSGSDSVEERIRGLDAGADDYVVKPFLFNELHARIRAVLRRGSRPARALLTVGDLELNRVSHEVRRGNRAIELSPKEFALLELLMRQPGQVMSRGVILEQVWHLGVEPTTNIVEVYINYLRRKVARHGQHPLIRTVRGVGYQIGGHSAAAP